MTLKYELAMFENAHDFLMAAIENVQDGKDARSWKYALILFCFSRNWTIPHDRLAYNREGGIGRGQKEEEFFSRRQGSDSQAASG
jgi:hypothetical protein